MTAAEQPQRRFRTPKPLDNSKLIATAIVIIRAQVALAETCRVANVSAVTATAFDSEVEERLVGGRASTTVYGRITISHSSGLPREFIPIEGDAWVVDIVTRDEGLVNDADYGSNRKLGQHAEIAEAFNAHAEVQTGSFRLFIPISV